MELIAVKRSQWAKIHRDFRGRWDNAHWTPAGYAGKRTVFAGSLAFALGLEKVCGATGTTLLTEGVHFQIIKG